MAEDAGASGSMKSATTATVGRRRESAGIFRLLKGGVDEVATGDARGEGFPGLTQADADHLTQSAGLKRAHGKKHVGQSGMEMQKGGPARINEGVGTRHGSR